MQFFCLTFFLSHALFLFFASSLLKISGSDTLLVCIFGTFFNFFLSKIFPFPKKKKEKKKVFSFLSFLLLFSLTFYLLKETSFFIQRNFLKEGSLFSLLLLLILLSLIISKRKLPQITSLSLLSFFLFLLSFFLQITGSMMNVRLTYMKPPFIHGIIPLLKGIILFSFTTFFPLFLLLFLDTNDRKKTKKEQKYFSFSILFSNIISTLEFFLIAIGPSLSLAKTYDYPYMLVINQTASFLLLDRFSYLFSIFVLLDTTILLGLLFLILKTLLPKKLKSFF